MSLDLKEDYEETLLSLRNAMKDKESGTHKKRSVLTVFNRVLDYSKENKTGALELGFSQGTVTQVKKIQVEKIRKEQ